MNGLKKAPAWIVQIEIARRWHLPPWKVVGGTKTLWYAREEAMRESEIKRMHKIEQEAKRNA